MDSSIFSPVDIPPGGIDARQLLAEARPVEYLVDKILPAEGLYLLAAAAKTGKTYAAMAMGIAIARGEPFLDLRTRRRGVIYVFLEDGRRRAAWRFSQLGLLTSDDVELFAMFDSSQIRPLLQRIAESKDPLFVVFDPLVVMERALGVEDENNALEIEGAFTAIRDAAQLSRSVVLIVHHFRKAGDTMRGSVALEGSTDGWINLRRVKDGSSKIVTAEYTLRDADPGTVAFELMSNAESRIWLEPREARRKDRRMLENDPSGPRARILALLKSRPGEQLTQSTIATALSVKRDVVQREISALESDGLVVRPDGPKSGYRAAQANEIDIFGDPEGDPEGGRGGANG